ncbi:MAG: hypothetical protein LBK42_12010 [Propionibacteriaceae bacterium]|nr:hypothetical protein [Propionibacteriaceae bacterium]
MHLLPRRQLAVWAGSAALGLAWLMACPALAQADDPTDGPADEVAFTVADPAVAGVTGMTRDTANSLYWLVRPGEAAPPPPEDDDPWDDVEPEAPPGSSTVVGVDAAGTVQARLSFKAATPHAAAVAFFDQSLYVADIADPALERATVTVYGLPASNVAGDQDVPVTAFEFVYPDGPHDAAALLIDSSGRLFIITTTPGANLYAADLPVADQVNSLSLVGAMPAGVTDGLYLSDTLIAVRTADQVLLVDAVTLAVGESDAIAAPGQSLALSLAGTELLTVGGEAAPAVTIVPVPSRDRVNQATVLDLSESDQSGLRGTLIMLVAAGAVALITGVLAFLRR